MSALIGSKIQLERNGTAIVDSILGNGGDATTYNASIKRTGQLGVIKVFNSGSDPDIRNHRTRFLLEQDLGSVHSIFCAPIDIIVEDSICGHFSPLVEGMPLASHFETAEIDFFENLEIATALAYALSYLHGRGIGYCDIHADNILLTRVNEGPRVSIIDFDNFTAAGQAAPNGFGQDNYMAPEQRKALVKDEFEPPSIQSDLFSLTVIIHELLLFVHPAIGFYKDKNELHRVMINGQWLYDPQRANKPINGLPSQILNSQLCRLFRKGLSANPNDRPAALDWAETLDTSASQIPLHGLCGKPVFTDENTSVCPHCGAEFPTLKLIFPALGREFIIGKEAVPIRRDHLKSDQVSMNHAVLQKIGPETYLQCYGRNGTFRKEVGKWVRLPDRSKIAINPGDKIRFANVEGDIRIMEEPR